MLAGIFGLNSAFFIANSTSFDTPKHSTNFSPVITHDETSLPFSREQGDPSPKSSSRVRTSTSAMVITKSLSYAPHDPIEVSNNTALAAVAVSGNGTVESPYVLEGWNITTNGVHGIYIRDTTAYFIIRNCWIKTEKFQDIRGIYISSVTTGTVTIVDNFCQESYYGIYLIDSENSTVAFNTCTQNIYGIRLFDNDCSFIVNNTCTYNRRGIYLSRSEYVLVANNTCIWNNWEGIYLDVSAHSTVINSLCKYNDKGIYFENSGSSLVANNTCNQNNRGIEIRYSRYMTIVNNTCQYNMYGIYLDQSNFANMGSNICSNNSSGFYIRGSENSIVVNNICSQNRGNGIILRTSNFSRIMNNTCRNNTNGISLDFPSTSVNITNNICTQNWRGIRISESTSVIIANNFCTQNGGAGIFLLDSNSSMVIENTCQNNGEGISLVDSNYSMVVENTCQNNWEGIWLYNSNLTTIKNNFCSQNRGVSICLEVSTNFTITNNTCTENMEYGIQLLAVINGTVSGNLLVAHQEDAIYLIRSNYTLISWNLLIDNQKYGINLDNIPDYPYISCYNISIHHNSFLNNNNGNIQAHDVGMSNQWFDSTTNEGNYWLDYGGTGVYHLSGSTGALDPFPLDDVLDFDADGIPDGWEVQNGLTPIRNDANADPDNDKLINFIEYQQRTNPHKPDSDGDGLIDGDEVQTYSTNPLEPDSDIDGMPDDWEVEMGLNPVLDDAITDQDNDGIPNFWEYQMGLNAMVDDSAADHDGDRMPNLWEYQKNLNARDPKDAILDPDGDGLTNLQEYQIGADPNDADSDNDFFPDNWDHGWWGNPRTNWDNPLTRGVFLTFLVTLFGLLVWSSFMAYRLPQLQQDLKRQFQSYRKLTNQFLDTVKVLQTSEDLNAVEAAADDLHLTFQACDESLLLAHRLVTRKWLLSFLRPDLTLWDTIFATVKDTYDEFQKTRLKRLDAKY